MRFWVPIAAKAQEEKFAGSVEGVGDVFGMGNGIRLSVRTGGVEEVHAIFGFRKAGEFTCIPLF